MLCLGGHQPVFREDEELMFFDTEEAAWAEIQECIDDVAEAVKKGDMSDTYSIEDYDVAPAIIDDGRITYTYYEDKYTMLRTDEDSIELK